MSYLHCPILTDGNAVSPKFILGTITEGNLTSAKCEPGSVNEVSVATAVGRHTLTAGLEPQHAVVSTLGAAAGCGCGDEARTGGEGLGHHGGAAAWLLIPKQ